MDHHSLGLSVDFAAAAIRNIAYIKAEDNLSKNSANGGAGGGGGGGGGGSTTPSRISSPIAPSGLRVGTSINCSPRHVIPWFGQETTVTHVEDHAAGVFCQALPDERGVIGGDIPIRA